jgi:hypothetical protein
MGPEGKPGELSVRTKPSSREAGGEEVASGSGSGCEECEEDEPGGGVGSRGRDGYQGEPLLGLPLCLGILTARGRWLGLGESPGWTEKGWRGTSCRRAPRRRRAGMSHFCAAGGGEGRSACKE